nr:immunoglobulin heavy chain junction region [Mus musculus]
CARIADYYGGSCDYW